MVFLILVFVVVHVAVCSSFRSFFFAVFFSLCCCWCSSSDSLFFSVRPPPQPAATIHPPLHSTPLTSGGQSRTHSDTATAAPLPRSGNTTMEQSPQLGSACFSARLCLTPSPLALVALRCCCPLSAATRLSVYCLSPPCSIVHTRSTSASSSACSTRLHLRPTDPFASAQSPRPPR